MNNIYEHTIVITNRSLVVGDYFSQIQKVTALHPHALILREKGISEEAYEQLADQVLSICRQNGVSCFLHSFTAVAEHLNCRNIHLSVTTLKNICDTGGIEDLHRKFDQISISCHSMEDLKIAVSCGASQIILGTIFETDCKKGLPGKGLEFVREICKNSTVPVYAIGGISLQNLPSVMEAGAAGGCMMSGFMKL